MKIGLVFGFCGFHFIGIGLISVCDFPENDISILNTSFRHGFGSMVGEVGGMPKLGQSRKSRLRRHGKEWKNSVHGDLKL